MRQRAAALCPDRCPSVESAPAAAYANPLGQYLGDGTIVLTRRGVHRLVVSWRPMGPYDISVARRTSVDLLDAIVGPKT
jgi:hypothetical protein